VDTPSSHDIDVASALLRDPAFAPLAEEAVRDYLDWDELTRRPLPAGLSAEDTWKLLTMLRRFGATRSPIRDMHGRTWWYTMTREGILCVDAIERYCRADSAVHRAVLHRHGQRLLAASRLREAVAVCELDGVNVSSEDAKQMLMGGRAPRNATDRLVANAHALLYEVDDVGDEPFSPELLRRLYDRLLDGVDLSKLERHSVRHGLTDRVEPDPITGEMGLDLVRQYCAYANGQTGDPSEPVTVKAHVLLNAWQYWGFFPEFSGIIGRCVFRLYATRRDYPVLGYLPISSVYQAWAQGRMSSSIVRFSSTPDPRTPSATDLDYTPDVLTYLQLTVAALDDLLMSIDHARRRDAEVRSVLEHDADLNYRQRSIIAQSMAHPEFEFRIREHQTTHNVVYATARADLLDLVERGYLRQELRGKAFVFLPEPDLVELLDKATGAGTPA
jgi:Fic family protein